MSLYLLIHYCQNNFTIHPIYLFTAVYSAASPKIIKLREESSDYSESSKGKSPAISNTLVPVKGIINLGNTCFFNAVMQVCSTVTSGIIVYYTCDIQQQK